MLANKDISSAIGRSGRRLERCPRCGQGNDPSRARIPQGFRGGGDGCPGGDDVVDHQDAPAGPP
jgi:hypothetical protein